MGTNTTLNGISGSDPITNTSGGNAILTSNVAAGSFNFTGVISDTAGNLLKFRKTGGGTQRLDGHNTYQGGTEIVAGVLRFGANDSLGTGAVEFTGAGILRAVPQNLTLANNIVLTANGTIDGNVSVLTGVISGAGSLTTTGALEIDNAGNSYSGGTVLNGGALWLGASNVLGGGDVTVSANGRLNAVTTAALSNAVVLNADLKVDNPGSTLTLNGVVSGGAGNRLTVREGATLNLTGSNTYIGNTYVASSATETSVLGIGNSLAVSGGLGSLIAATVDPARLATIRALANGYVIPNLVRIQGDVAIDTNGHDFGISGKINDFNAATPGALTVTGGGVLTLSGTGNNYSLGTTVRGNATLAVDADNLLGAAGTTIHLDVGTLKVTGTGYTSTSRTIDVGTLFSFLDIDDASVTFTPSLIQGPGGLYKFGAGTLALTGVNTQGFTYLTNGVMTIDAAAALGTGAFYFSGGTLKPLADVNLPSVINTSGSGTIDTNGHTIELAGGAFGGGFTKAGAGILILSGNDTFATALTVSAGELRLTGTGSIGNGAAAANFAAGTILSTLNSRTITNNLGLTGPVTIDDTGHSVTLSGVVSGAGGIEKPGSGTMTLTGTNTFTGDLNIYAGKVLVNGSNNASANTYVGSGATLGGSGSIGGTVFIDNGGHLAPGNSPGTLSVGNLTLNSGSFLDFELANPAVIGGGVNDLIVASGNITLDGTLNVTALPGFTPGTYRLINYGGALTNNGLSIGTIPMGYMLSDFTISFAPGQVNLMVGLVVPGTLYWDGSGAANDGTIAGGSGTWNAANTNWTNSTGTFNYAWNSQNGVFQTVGGAVAVVGSQAFDKLSFLVDGYTLTGGTLAGSAVAEVEVDGTATTISSVISGASGLTKSGTGTLILTGTNTFNGLTVSSGAVAAGSDSAFGVGALNFADGTTLRSDGDRTIANGIVLGGGVTVDSDGSTLNLQGVISGSGPLTIYEPTSPTYGLTTLAAGNTYTGGTVINYARLQIGADSALGAAGTSLTLIDEARLRTTASFSTTRNVILSDTTGFEPASGTTLTLGGVVSGARLGGRGAGTGTLVLANAANSFSGLDIFSGVVAVNSDGAAGTGDIVFASSGSGTLRFGSAFNLMHDITLSGDGIIDTAIYSVGAYNTISGGGSLTKVGGGELVLNSFGNTYSGGTFVNSGNLTIYDDNNLGTGGLTLGVDGVSGATLQLNGSIADTRAVTIAEDSTIQVTFGSDTALFNGVVSGTGKITKTGPGTLALGGNNTFSGGIDLMTGTLSLRSDNAAGTGTITTFGSVIDYANGVTIATPVNINSNTTQLQVLTGLATQNGNISEMTGPRPLEKIGAGQLNLGGSNSFTGTFSISAGTVGVNSTTALGLGAVAMANGTAVQAIQSLVLQNNFALTGTDTFDTQGFDLILNGTLSGAGAVNKIGSGRLLLYGANSYGGGTALNAGQILIDTNTGIGTGTLTMQNGTRFGPLSSGLVVANQIIVNGTSEVSSGTGIFTLTGAISGPGTLLKTNSGTLVITNNSNTHNGTTINEGTVAVFSDGALGAPFTALTFAGPSTLQMLANVDLFRPVQLDAAGTIDTQGFDGNIFGGFISGAGSLTKIGTGRLTISGTDDYTGGTFLNQGTLRIESGGGLGSGALTTTGGTTFVTGVVNNANIMLPNDIVLGAGTTTLDIVGMNSVQVYATDTYTSNGTTLGLNGTISGSGTLNVVGTGKVTFAGNNSFSGGTVVDQALIQVTNNNALGTGALTLNGFSGLRNNSGGAVTLGNTVTFNGATNTVGGNSNLTLSGAINGGADLVKVGTDTVNLTGNATGFTGDTDIVNGKLLINTFFGAGGGQAVNVLTGATLGGEGIIFANVNVGSNAIYAPGNSPGTMIIVGNLNFANNAIINYDLGEASVIGGLHNDQTTVFGNLSFGANSTLNVTDSFAFGLGVYNLFTYTGTLTGTGPNTVNLPGGYSGFVQAAVPGFVNLIVGMPGALVQYWDGGDMVGNGAIDGGTGTWDNTNTNWTTNAPSVLNSTWQGGVAVFQGAAGTVSLTAVESFQGLQFSTTGYTIINNVLGGLTANGATFIATDPGVTATINATIGGTGSILKQNAGTLILGGGNTYSGGTTVSAGTLQVTSNNALGTGGLALQNGSTLQAGAHSLTLANTVALTGATTVDTQGFAFKLANTISGSGSLAKNGSGILILGGNNSYSGGTLLNLGEIIVETDTALGTGALAMANTTLLTAGAANLMLGNDIGITGRATVNDSGSVFPGTVFTLNGVISGGALNKVGTGTVVLTNANTYTGGTWLVEGALQVNNNLALGTGQLRMFDGTILSAGANGLVLANTVQTDASSRVNSGPGIFTLNGQIGGAGSISQIGTGNLVLNGNNSFTNLGINQGRVTLGTNTAAGIGGIAINNGTTLAAGVSGLVIANGITTTGSGSVDSGPGIFTLNGQIGGAGSISQIGTGNLVLNGNNSFTNLGINQGRVTLGTNTAAGIGGIAINNGTTLAAGVSGLVIANGITTTGSGSVDSGPGIFTLNGQIGGAGSISQIGTGNLVLNGNNSFTNLGINQGTVTVGTNTAAGVGGIAINDGATLAAGANGLVLANGITTTGSGRVNSGPGIFTLNGQIGGAGSISQIGTGNLVLNGNNSFTNLGINQGRVTLGTNTAAGIGGIAINNGTTLAAGVSGLVIANGITTTGSGSVDSGPGIFTLNGQIGGAGSISQIGTGNLVLNGNNSFTNLGINQGRVTLGTNTAAGIGGIAINNGTTLAAGVSGLVIANGITTTGSGSVDSGPGIFTLNGQIGGAGSISQIGTGNLVLNGNNSFTNLGINQGTVTVGTNTAAGVGGIAINDGATLAAGANGLVLANGITTTGSGRVNSGPGIFTLNGQIGGAGSISQIGTGNLVLNGNNSFTAGLGINQGTVTLGTNTAGGTSFIAINNNATLAAGVSGLVVANAIDTTQTGFVDSGAGVFTLSGPIGGAGSINKVGSGNLILSGMNSFAAGLRIAAGTVTLNSVASASTGAITIDDGGILAAGASGLALANAVVTTGSGRVDSGPGIFTLNGQISGAGSISQIGTGNLVLNGSNSFAAGLGINQGTVTVGTNTAAGTGAITINNGAILAAGVSGLTLANNIETTASGRINSGAGTLTVNGNIGNLGSISQIGTGNLILNGNNSFAAGLGINQGTVTVGTNTAAGTGAITLNGAGTLAAGINGLTLANNIETTGNGRIDSGTGTFTLSGHIGNTGGFTKIGSGNLILSGSSNYMGATLASAGRLTVNGSLASTVTVQTGATLAGGGSIGGLVTQSGGTVSPGAPEGTVGTLTVTGNASFASGSTYLVTVSGTSSDRIAIGGTATLGGANLSVVGGSIPAVFGTTYTVLTATGGRSGAFTPVFSGFGQAFNPTVVYGANDVRLTLAPASIVGLLGGGANGSQNITNFAAAFDASVAAGFNPQNFFPIFLQSGAALGASLNSLTGEITSANSRTAIANTRYIRDAALERLEARLGDGGNGRGDQVATVGDGDNSVAFWVQGVGAWTDSDSDGNGSKLNIDAKGVVTGIGASFGNWKVGGLFNYIDSKVDTTTLGRGTVDSTGGGLYAGYRGDSGFAFGAGGAVSHVSSKENRNVIAPIAQSLRSKTSGTVYQAFGEISYDLAASENARVEPFLRAAYVSYHVDAINEAGGFAALNIAKGKYDSTVLTGGLRGSVLLGGSAWLKGSAGYQYTTGDRSPVSLVSLSGTSGQAAIRAVPLDKSAFAGSLGIDFRITPAITLGAGYNGVIGKNTQDHGARATLTVGF